MIFPGVKALKFRELCGVNFTPIVHGVSLAKTMKYVLGTRYGTASTYSDLFRSELANLSFESVLAVVPIEGNDVIRCSVEV